jgi:hypothetical protein
MHLVGYLYKGLEHVRKLTITLLLCLHLTIKPSQYVRTKTTLKLVLRSSFFWYVVSYHWVIGVHVWRQYSDLIVKESNFR